MTAPRTADEWALWHFQHERITQALNRIERAERAILKGLGCPPDEASVYAILNGEQPPPWPKRTAARDRERAKHAMFALAYVGIVRSHIALGHEDAQAAALEALTLGALAGDVAIDAALGRRIRSKNASAATRSWIDRADASRSLDAQLTTLVSEYRSRKPHGPGASTRQMAAALARRLSQPVNTVRGRLLALGLR